MESSYVMCVLPKAGLGNQLFPLMKAVVFAHIHALPLKVIGFHQIKIGPYLRGEKSKRKYGGYFTLENNIVREWLDETRFRHFNRLPVVREPKLDAKIDPTTSSVYLFDTFDYRDYFFGLKEYREIVIRLFWEILTEEVKNEFIKRELPVVGIHIRRGDFKEDWRTSDDYFLSIIRTIRDIGGADLPISIFTDAYAHELEKILSVPDVKLVEGNKDIVDLLLLSKSKVIVVSSGSTFGYWASFLSNAPLILPPGHNATFKSVRENNDKLFYEGVLDVGNDSLIKQLKESFLILRNE
jgi:hypothetical protein